MLCMGEDLPVQRCCTALCNRGDGIHWLFGHTESPWMWWKVDISALESFPVYFSQSGRSLLWVMSARTDAQRCPSGWVKMRWTLPGGCEGPGMSDVCMVPGPSHSPWAQHGALNPMAAILYRRARGEWGNASELSGKKKNKIKAKTEPIDGNGNVLLSLCCFLCMLVKKWSQSVWDRALTSSF